MPSLGVGAGWFEASLDKVVSATTIGDVYEAVFARQLEGGVAQELKPAMAISRGYRCPDSNDMSLVRPSSGNITADGAQIQNPALACRYRFEIQSLPSRRG